MSLYEGECGYKTAKGEQKRGEVLRKRSNKPQVIRKGKRSRNGRIQNGEEGRGEGQQKPIMYKKNYTVEPMMLYTNYK